MDRNFQNKEYRFNEKKHLHELLVAEDDWRPLTGVTTVLGVINKPALIQWSANMTVEWLRINAPKSGEAFIVTEVHLNEAKVAHRKKKESAGTWGTEIHSRVEQLINFWIENKEGFASNEIIGSDDEIVVKAMNHFIDWAIANKVRFLASERHVYSKDMFVGGIADIVCEIGGKLYIGDIKTSSGIYPEHFIQASAYAEMLREMGAPQADGVIVINLNKTGGIEVSTAYNPKRYFEAFKSALNIYRLMEELKKL